MEEIKYATFWQRLAAFLIDIVLFFLILVVLSLSWQSIWKESTFTAEQVLILGMVWFGYFVVFQAINGFTLGKKLLKIRIVDKEGNKPKILRFFFREGVGKLVSFLPMYAGFISMWIDDEGKTWHDKIARTKVISEKKYGHIRNVKWFYGVILITFLLQIYPIYLGIVKFVNRQNDENPCRFEILSGPTRTNHFDIYVEDPKRQEQMFMEGELFERAFDYAFWSISEVKEKVTRSTVCIYSNDTTYKQAWTLDGMADWGAAYYNPLTNVINFWPGYWTLERDRPFADYYGLGIFVYHEISHYVIDNYFYQNQSSEYVDTWFNEGLAQHFSENCKTPFFKLNISNNRISWEEMNQNYYSNNTYTVYDYYQQSCLMVEFMLEKYGNEFPRKIVKKIIDDGVTMRDAIFEDTGGKSYQVLDEEWQKWLKEEI